MSDPPALLVLDLDGTLVDTAADLVATLNAVLKLDDVPALSIAQALPLVGAGSRALVTRAYAAAGRTLTPERLDALFLAFLRHYEEHIADASALYPGVVDALDRFAAAGWILAVCTNKIERASIKLLSALGVADRFRAICGQDTFKAGDLPISKPDPQALLLTIAKAGGDRRRAVMVGDSRTDVETARSAGVPIVAVDFGYADAPIRALSPDRVISRFSDLWDAVASLPAVRQAGLA
ncbi:MAG TPA: HAD family hydrolase [Beijerinckiaceae bacterium]|nr:HAD family hydrolase [Beijerinckiaceae bacterium]